MISTPFLPGTVFYKSKEPPRRFELAHNSDLFTTTSHSALSDLDSLSVPCSHPTMAPSSSFKSAWTQFFPPKPKFTEKDIPADLQGKVYMVTGANCGMGLELARILYARNAKVYLACRSAEKTAIAITGIKTAAPKSTGQLIFLSLDLADLGKVKAAAQSFLAQ
jgi:hypothetical protein